MICRNSTTVERVMIDGPNGRLSAKLGYGEGLTRAACVLINPHPHMGGHIDNPLIRSLAKQLLSIPAATLRFEYSGVGDSEGDRVDVAQSMMTFWNTGAAPEDERFEADARVVTRWARDDLALPIVLIGYSFGAFVAHRIADGPTLGRILICPTLTQHAFRPLSETDSPTSILYSDNDFATPHDTITQWIATAQPPTRSLCIPGADHFMRGHETTVADECICSVRAWLHAGGTS